MEWKQNWLGDWHTEEDGMHFYIQNRQGEWQVRAIWENGAMRVLSSHDTLDEAISLLDDCPNKVTEGKDMNIVRSEISDCCDIIPTKTFERNDLRQPVYEVRLSPLGGTFLVVADHKQDAFDELIDWLDDSGEYPGYFLDDQYIQELKQDATKDGREENDYLDEYVNGGNYGKYLSFCWIDCVVERVM